MSCHPHFGETMTRTRTLAWVILVYEVAAAIVMTYEVVAYGFGAIDRNDFVVLPPSLTVSWLVRQGVSLVLAIGIVGYLGGVRFLTFAACYAALLLTILQASQALRELSWGTVTVPISAILYVLLAVGLQRELSAREPPRDCRRLG